MDRLILLTANYPFLPGEEFLETEIEYLCQGFESVDVLPVALSAFPPASARRPLPPNANLRTDVARYVALRKRSGMRRGLEAVRSLASLHLFVSDLRRAAAFGPAGMLRLGARLAYALLCLRALRVHYGSSIGEGTWLYAYWLDHSALAAALVSQGTGAVCVSRAHGADLYSERSMPPFLPLQRQIIQRLDRVFLVSEHGLRYLEGKYRDMGRRLALSRLGVPARSRVARHSQDGVLRLLSCSYAVPVKRLDVLARALEFCGFPVQWTHIGDGPMLEGIKATAQGLPVNVDARFPGHLSNREVLRYYETERVDLFVNVSSSEGLPVSIMEAMSYGVPVLATAVGGVPELVSTDVGYLLEQDATPQQIAGAIRRFREASAAQKARLREASLARWRQTVNADRQYPDFVAALKATVRERDASTQQGRRTGHGLNIVAHATDEVP